MARASLQTRFGYRTSLFRCLCRIAFLVAWFSAVRRRVERDLRQARDHLQIEVAERTQQASLLNLTHDTIFVRDSAGLITYWNRGAEELYGWAAENALGTDPQQLLQTVYPAPTDQIHEELQHTGRWEGELKITKADGTVVVVASRWTPTSPLAIIGFACSRVIAMVSGTARKPFCRSKSNPCSGKPAGSALLAFCSLG